MKHIVQTLEAAQPRKKYPDFRAGDTIVVQIRIKEGSRERFQAFEGVVLAKRNRGFNSSFIVRKISHGEGVERTFPLYSPLIADIELKRQGAVRKAKIYYLRNLRGKAARIKEKLISKGSNKLAQTRTGEAVS
jgi:large subunit ribosomal protein L19